MFIKSEKIPFYVLVASAFVPILSAVFQLDDLSTIFNTAVGLIALIFLVNRYSSLTTKSSILVIFSSALLFAGFYLVVFRMNVFGSSIITVVLFAMFYLLYFLQFRRCGDEIKKTLNLIYAIHLAGIFVETIFVYTGNVALLAGIMHGKYRDVYNQLLIIFDIYDYGSLQSLFLMPQAAGHLTALGILLLLLSTEWTGPKKMLFTPLIFVMFMLSLNTTSLVILCFVLIVVFVVINYEKTIMLVTSGAVVSGFIVFNYSLVKDILLYKFVADEALDRDVTGKYVENFTSSLDAFYRAGLLEKVIGHGKDLTGILKSGDNNLFNILLHQGMISLSFFLIFIIYVLSVAMSSYIKAGNKGVKMLPEVKENRRLILINALMVVAWCGSIIHYPVATVTPGIHLFAYSAAATLFYAFAHKRILSSRTKNCTKRALSMNALWP